MATLTGNGADDYTGTAWTYWTQASGTVTTASPWTNWCDATTATTITTATTSTAWVIWTAADTGTADTGTTDATWGQWVVTGTIVGSSTYVDERTPEQVAADRARWAEERAAIEQRAREAEAVRVAARDRARALLLSMLDAQQRAQYERDLFFEVIARHSRRRYRIRQGTHGNVRLIDDQGREVTSYCAQPVNVPDEDAMLAQKLMIEHEEDRFLRVANARRLAA